MKILIRYIGTILALLIGGATISAAPPERVAVTVDATDPTPTIGDSLTFIVTVSLPAGITTDIPYLPSESPYLDIQPQWERSDSTGMDATVYTYGFLAYVFKPDTLEVGPFLVDYTSADGDSGTVITDAYTLQVGSVLQGQGTTPNPDRSPLPMPDGFPWLVFTGVLALLAIIASVIWWRRRYTLKAETSAPIDDLDIFRHIAAMRLHESGEYRKLYILLSDAIREYIFRRLGYDARFRTTAEIHLSMAGFQLHRSTIPLLLDMLLEADLVKFAQYAPPCDKTASCVDRTVTVVQNINTEIAREETRLVEEQATSAKQNSESAAIEIEGEED